MIGTATVKIDGATYGFLYKDGRKGKVPDPSFEGHLDADGLAFGLGKANAFKPSDIENGQWHFIKTESVYTGTFYKSVPHGKGMFHKLFA